MLSFRRPKDPYQYLRDNPGMKWTPVIPIPTGPIQYLEIGVCEAINAIDVLKSYCTHTESVIHCVDPWTEYEEYPEYKGEIQTRYQTAMRNIQRTGQAHKFKIYRDFSDKIVPMFPDNYFDIIFIDGNHETEYVYRDGVMSFEKVKQGGFLIFDDYSDKWPQTIFGIDKFLVDYKDRLSPPNLHPKYGQMFVQKL
jgi:hypothetical protein